jgi:hypothetical protein
MYRTNSALFIVTVICFLLMTPYHAQGQNYQQDIIGKWISIADGDVFIHEYSIDRVIQTVKGYDDDDIFEYRIENNKFIVDDQIFILEFQGQDILKMISPDKTELISKRIKERTGPLNGKYILTNDTSIYTLIEIIDSKYLKIIIDENNFEIKNYEYEIDGTELRIKHDEIIIFDIIGDNFLAGDLLNKNEYNLYEKKE